jgi:SSS family transporter
MSGLDWFVLLFTLTVIVAYGVYKSRNQQSMESYFLANQSLPWYHICLSVMATQASAITFLSAPGQGFTNGMGFVQFYFGLPLAMIVLSITFIPVFHRLKVYTAYEYLETRFNHKTRALTATLFLIQRGISTGISIYAPAIILSSILNISIQYTSIFIGTLVIIYTYFGGTKAVSYTQKLQMMIIFGGLIAAFVTIIKLLPEQSSLINSMHLAGKMGKMKIIDTHFDWNNRYNLWSGLIGGFFLQLSYFGTDQSQVGRYLTGKSINESRLGLLMNGFIKIPMQFFILLIGVMVFVFYQFNTAPISFNKEIASKYKSGNADLNKINTAFEAKQQEKIQTAYSLQQAITANNDSLIEHYSERINQIQTTSDSIRNAGTTLLKKQQPDLDGNDSNYIFLSFVTAHLPKGMIGLLIAVIFLASMGSLSAGLNALSSTTMVDVYSRSFRKNMAEKDKLPVSRIITIGWGLFCIISALLANRMGNLLEAVNILGSLFYGTILGIFLVAFYLKSIRGNTVFVAAIITELAIVLLWYFNAMAFLWLNVVGCLGVMLISQLIQLFPQRIANKNG